MRILTRTALLLLSTSFIVAPSFQASQTLRFDGILGDTQQNVSINAARA